MRFLVDAQLPPARADRLGEAGFEAEHVNRIGFGAAADAVIWSEARSRGAVLVTKDEDFLTMAVLNREGPPIVWIRLGNVSNQALWSALEPALPDIIKALSAGERVIEVP